MAGVVHVVGVLIVFSAMLFMGGVRSGGVCHVCGVRIVCVSGVGVSGGRRAGVVLVMLGVLIVFVCGFLCHTFPCSL